MSDNYVGRAITELRERAKMTQQALADALGQHQVVIARWESGARTPSLADLPRIASALGVKPEKVAKKISEKSAESG